MRKPCLAALALPYLFCLLAAGCGASSEADADAFDPDAADLAHGDEGPPDEGPPDEGPPDEGPPDEGPPAPACDPIMSDRPVDGTCQHLMPSDLPPIEPACPEGAPGAVTADLDWTEFSRRPIDARFRVEGAPAPDGWAIEGALPPGLAFDPCAGRLFGTPLWAEGALRVVALYHDEAGGCASTAATVDFGDIAVCAIAIDPRHVDLPAARVGEPFEAQMNVWQVDGPAPPRPGVAMFRLADGALPPGLALDCETGALAGVPEAPGAYAFAVHWMEFECGGVDAIDTYTLTVEP